MGAADLVERVSAADGHSEIATNGEVEKFSEARVQRILSQQWGEGKPGHGLIPEDEPEQLGDAEMEIPNVEGTVNHKLPLGRKRFEALASDGSTDRFINDAGACPARGGARLFDPAGLGVVDASVGAEGAGEVASDSLLTRRFS